jgi:hypothetical protein
MKYVLISFILLATLPSCTNSLQKEFEKKYADAMYIHDEAMANMSALVKLKRKISNNPALPETEASEAISLLDKADKQMMLWMRNFKKPTEVNESSISYLDKQIAEIKEVADKIDLAISTAQKLLDEK